jgi:hypothetical protein
MPEELDGSNKVELERFLLNYITKRCLECENNQIKWMVKRISDDHIKFHTVIKKILKNRRLVLYTTNK